MDGKRVVVVHDYLTQRGGAERVALALLRAFPGSRLVTSVYRPDRTFAEFAEHDVETLWVDRLTGLADHRTLLPLLPGAFSGHVVDDADVVLCSSSGFAHGIGTSAPRVVYCHNPARWLYQPDDYLRALPPAARRIASTLMRPLRDWDQRHARSAATYLANSTAVAARIERVYDRPAAVVHPPVGIDPQGPLEPVPGLEPGFLLTVGRNRGYKHTSVLCEAVAAMPDQRLVVVGGLPEPAAGRVAWPDNLVGLSGISDAQLRWVYSSCRALLAISHEDFGLTPLEANSFGRPVLALRAGGYLDSVVEGLSGLFVDTVDPGAVREGIGRLQAASFDEAAVRMHADQFSPRSFARALHAEVEAVAALL